MRGVRRRTGAVFSYVNELNGICVGSGRLIGLNGACCASMPAFWHVFDCMKPTIWSKIRSQHEHDDVFRPPALTRFTLPIQPDGIDRLPTPGTGEWHKETGSHPR